MGAAGFYAAWMTAAMAAFEFLRKGRPPTIDRGVVIGGLCLAGGVAFGGTMYLVSRLFSRRWVRLRRLLDSEDLRAPPEMRNAGC